MPQLLNASLGLKVRRQPGATTLINTVPLVQEASLPAADGAETSGRVQGRKVREPETEVVSEITGYRTGGWWTGVVKSADDTITPSKCLSNGTGSTYVGVNIPAGRYSFYIYKCVANH